MTRVEVLNLRRGKLQGLFKGAFLDDVGIWILSIVSTTLKFRFIRGYLSDGANLHQGFLQGLINQARYCTTVIVKDDIYSEYPR